MIITRGVFYTLDHEIGSDLFIIRGVNYNKFIRRQKDTMTTRQLNIQNRTHYFHNDLISLWNFHERNLKVDKKSWKDLDIYYLGYIDKKPEWHVNSVNQLYFIVNRVYGSISEENGIKYLTIDKPENILKKYKEVFSEIKQKIEKISGER